MATERTVEGLGVSSGIGIGFAYVVDSGRVRVPELRIAPGRADAELQRLRDAVIKARRQVSRLRGRLRSRARAMPQLSTEDFDYLLDAYLHMLRDSRLIRGAADRISRDRLSAEAAVQAEVAAIGTAFKEMNDSYLAARIDDIREVGNRLLQQLTKANPTPLSNVPRGSIIIADELTPADTAQLDPDSVVGIAAQLGGPQGHTAIMARALGLPAVLGAPGLLDIVRSGDPILLDGDVGQVIINPTPRSLLSFQQRQGARRREEKELRRLKGQPAVTRDGVAIGLQANVELPIEMDHVVEVGACGIGLLRTEFLFLSRPQMPSEDEQYEVLRSIIVRCGGVPVTVRTLDLGGDKGGAAMIGQFGESAASPLGLRGIRLSLARSEVLDVQFCAILRAAAHGPVRIMLPMVTTVEEVRAARDILGRAARRLLRRGVPIPSALPPLGAMIEVPGAALTAEALARACDFFAIGSNDLTMYTLAIDRADERVAHLYNPLHLGVMRMIEYAAATARAFGIPCSICGEIAGDPRFTALLLGLGFRELSMAPASIPRVKKRVLELDIPKAQERAKAMMNESDPLRLQMLLDDIRTPEAERDAC
ncbi:MAG: phosphoenolpyruvate--protein phosphotransferase [Rhodospirillales bacterium]|nr:phosphoenolpyruvate--protein phosphotransferase [Rhodospirillales bacterium]